MIDQKKILCFSGHDPSGGAGIQADIETALTHGVHCCTIPTAYTVQNSKNIKECVFSNAEFLDRQLQLLDEDMTFDAIKIGIPGNLETIQIISSYIQQNDDIPVIFDPVLAAGGGAQIIDDETINAIKTLLLPQVFLLTPNTMEFNLLGTNNLDDQANVKSIFESGVNHLLVTGTHDNTSDITHRLYTPENTCRYFSSKRLEGHYHGSGCTLATAITCQLTRDPDLHQAIELSLIYTAETLRKATSPGKGQQFPLRG